MVCDSWVMKANSRIISERKWPGNFEPGIFVHKQLGILGQALKAKKACQMGMWELDRKVQKTVGQYRQIGVNLGKFWRQLKKSTMERFSTQHSLCLWAFVNSRTVIWHTVGLQQDVWVSYTICLSRWSLYAMFSLSQDSFQGR
jgi:hypothetical protein